MTSGALKPMGLIAFKKKENLMSWKYQMDLIIVLKQVMIQNYKKKVFFFPLIDCLPLKMKNLSKPFKTDLKTVITHFF